jgi:hypothetical protein
MRYVTVPGIALLAAVLLAGCGGSRRPAAHLETIPSDGSFPQITVTVYGNSTADCAGDAEAYARNARLLVGHSGPDAGYPGDLYYFNMRNAFRDFQVRACPRSIISGILAQRLTRKELRFLLSHLPTTMTPVIRAALAR